MATAPPYRPPGGAMLPPASMGPGAPPLPGGMPVGTTLPPGSPAPGVTTTTTTVFPGGSPRPPPGPMPNGPVPPGALSPGRVYGPGTPGSSPIGPGFLDLSMGPGGEDPEFEEMVGDLRRSFIGWLKKTEMEIKQQKAELARARQAFEEEKLSVWQQFMAEKQREVDKIRDDRKRSEEETAGSLKQVQGDIEEARRRIEEERRRSDQEHAHRRRTVAHDYDKFRQEYGLFEAERQRLVAPQLAAESTIDLNVGGTVFETARSTLVQQNGSFLAQLLSGRHQLSRDRAGRIFINRDPEYFRTILNFLRNPQTPPMPRDAADSEALVREASFYGVHFFPFPLVFACGGHDGYEHLRAMEVLDVGNQCWRPCKPMGTERTYFGSATLRSRLHVFGGQNLEFKALCELEVYDCLRDTWEQGASLTVPRRNCASTDCDGRIYAIGGFDGTKIIGSVEVYDARMRGWMLLEPLPTPRSSAMACSHMGKVWVMGGTNGTRLRTIDIYDPVAGKWEASKVTMQHVRSAGQACDCINHLFALGGTDADQNIHYSMECLDGEELIFSLRRSMQESRMDFAATVISDSVMVGGGQNGGVLSSTEFYRPELDEWQAGPSMMFPRYGHQYLLVTL